ncbi:hypothetical protein EDB85DRAFT_1902115 [Lactarius pseudohatsudake]|nr:hypothetical protein EDB85DRAFT_1902115 [Lactarius pseudohatsudake]
MPALVLRAGRRRRLFAQYASAPALDYPLASSPSTPPRVITVDSPLKTPIMLFGLVGKLLRALLKAVWKGLKGAIGPLVARTNEWRFRLDVKVHLTLANGSGDVFDRSFRRFDSSCLAASRRSQA